MKPLQKSLISGLSALVALVSAAHAVETLGTINLVQVSAQKQTLPPDFTETTSLGGQITDKLYATTQRINSRTIIEAIAADESTGFPTGTPISGWNLVEIIDDAGVSVGLFVYKPGFQPIQVTDSFLSINFPEASFETYITVIDQSGITSKDNHYFTSDVTGTLMGTDTTFTGVFYSTSSIHNVGPRLAPLTHTAVVRKGTFSGNTADYSLNGSLTSIGKGNLVSIQAFVDAAGGAPASK